MFIDHFFQAFRNVQTNLSHILGHNSKLIPCLLVSDDSCLDILDQIDGYYGPINSLYYQFKGSKILYLEWAFVRINLSNFGGPFRHKRFVSPFDHQHFGYSKPLPIFKAF